MEFRNEKIILPVAVIALAMRWTSAFAQVNPSSPPASQSMQQALPAEADGSNAGNKTVTALHDLKTTAKVKAALLGDQLTVHSHLHVSTADGVVTLSGNVLSPYVTARAVQLAKQTEGVKEVVNNLKIAQWIGSLARGPLEQFEGHVMPFSYYQALEGLSS